MNKRKTKPHVLDCSAHALTARLLEQMPLVRLAKETGIGNTLLCRMMRSDGGQGDTSGENYRRLAKVALEKKVVKR